MAVKNHRQQPRTHDSNNQIGSHHDTLLWLSKLSTIKTVDVFIMDKDKDI